MPFLLPFDDPLLRQVPIGARLVLSAREWGWTDMWNNDSMHMDIRKGVEAEVVRNENLEALALLVREANSDMSWHSLEHRSLEHRCFSRNLKIYFTLCPHSTPGHFNVDRGELHTGVMTVSNGSPTSVCTWCKCKQWTTVCTMVRKHRLPAGLDLRIGSYLSLQLRNIFMFEGH
jgi:hypothetical protein